MMVFRQKSIVIRRVMRQVFVVLMFSALTQPSTAQTRESTGPGMLIGLQLNMIYEHEPFGGRDPLGFELGGVWQMLSKIPEPLFYASVEPRVTFFSNSSDAENFERQRNEDGERICWDRRREREVDDRRCRFFSEEEYSAMLEMGIFLNHLIGAPVGVGAGYRLGGSLEGTYYAITYGGGFVVRGNSDYVLLSFTIPLAGGAR